MYLVIVPAYGRDYKSKKAVLQAWKEGWDFQVNNFISKWDGKYLSVRDTETLKKEGVTGLQVRFCQSKKVDIIKL